MSEVHEDLRCHWCGGEASVIRLGSGLRVACNHSDCDALSPRADTREEAIASHGRVAPALGKVFGTPRKPGWYVRCDHDWTPVELKRFDPPANFVWVEDGAPAYYQYLGPLPEPVEPKGGDS